ncbi:unnamed protein product [Cuscuta campestris]|uniref:Retrovirus-related Pol polyprotein from transposon TNT 1-94-like beta-barrel domain-containing protein n=1 Tax=Cuscuta campestris TaxID=132261 RepID=A0A484LQL3_9ASTE|nr:unnamed protein product [Cuscuta campestris]
MAPTNPETWTHGPSIIKENELREVAVLLGKGFRIHHPDAVGGISLSYNPNPQKYMVMQYHSVENGFRLPLHGLLRDLCLHFGFAPGQLTANAHKYVASYILRCCALDRTPKLDEFLLLFSIGGFPFYSLYPHNHFPIFEKVEFKYEKWSLRYFVIEFPAHSPLDLPGVVLRRSISRTKFAAAELAEGVFNALREKEGLISHHSLQDAQLYKKAGFYHPLGPDPFPFEGVPSPERSKAPSAAESNPAMSSTGNGRFHCLGYLQAEKEAVEQKDAEVPPEMRRETETQQNQEEQREPEERHPATAPSAVSLPIQRKFTPQTYPVFTESWAGFSRGWRSLQASHWTIQANLEKMRESVQEPAIPQARPDLLALNALHFMEQAQQSLLTLTEEYLGGASGNYRAVVLPKEKELPARALQQKVDSLEQQVQEQIAAYQRGTQDLEAQFHRLRAQISILESRASASEDKVGNLEAGLVEKESRISELENSLQEAKHESSRFNEFALKQMEARRLTLEKLKEERQTASELRLKMDELEKTTAAHQEEVATLAARAEALYEEGKFDMQQCIYEAVQRGYDDWKIMMEAHLYALHDCMWMVLEDGPLKIQMENPERNPATPDVKSLNKELGILKSQEAVNKLLETTKHKGRKGLGFDSSSSKRKGKTTFIPPKPTAKPNKQKGKEKEKPTEVPKKEAAKYPGVWYLDSGCSRHVMGDASLLSNLISYDGPRVTFGGSNDFGLTKGLGNLVYKGITIQVVSYVEGLNYNLLSISQFCDKGYSLEFCKNMASLKNISTNEVILTGKRIRNIYEVIWSDVKEACLISKDKDEEVNEGDRMKPTEFIPFKSVPLKTSQRNPDLDSAEPSGNIGQPSNIPDLSNGDNSGNGDPVRIHPETPTTSVLQPEAGLNQPVNPNQHNLRWVLSPDPSSIYRMIDRSTSTVSPVKLERGVFKGDINPVDVHGDDQRIIMVIDGDWKVPVVEDD